MTAVATRPDAAPGEVRASRTRRLVRIIVSVLAVCWMILALIGSIGVLAPWVPFLGLAGLYVNGYAAQLFLVGLVGVAAALAVRRLGRRRTALVTGVVAGVTLACATIPTVALMATAHRLGAPVSLPRALVPARNAGTAVPARTVRYSSGWSASRPRWTVRTWTSTYGCPTGARPGPSRPSCSSTAAGSSRAPVPRRRNGTAG
jgi:hypothetical protein